MDNLDHVMRQALADYGVTVRMENHHDFMDDYGFDSLDPVELVMIVEEVFNIEVNDDLVRKVQTVADFKNAVAKSVLNG